jgi:hypothetical protein
MSPLLARLILLFAFVGGSTWTVFARLKPGWGEWYTTSETLNRAFTACSQILVLYMLLLLCLVHEALPPCPGRIWLALLILLACYSSGHLGWRL